MFCQPVFAGSLTISGISSGGFMAAQMATIYSDKFSGVGTVAGGVYYCAKNHFQEKINQFGSSSYFAFNYDPKNKLGKNATPAYVNPTYQAVGICMGNPEQAHAGQDGAMNLEFLQDFETRSSIAPVRNIARQKVFIYQGQEDDVVKAAMVGKLEEFYARMGVDRRNLVFSLRSGGHNFPTDRKDGIACNEEKVPYVASCDYDLAGDILKHTLGRKLQRTAANLQNLRVVEQRNAPGSVHTYGYLYANDFCLSQPDKCDLHVALHGCKMSDDYDEAFQQVFETKVQVTRVMGVTEEELKARVPQMGARKFAETSGYAEYAEAKSNRLMVYFPQTRISVDNYPANPKGCWDWYGWTGSEYATNQGEEPQWMIQQIQAVRENPQALIIK